ncbi:hypothetical protein [Bacillus sp. FJAT-44742]|uniref:hypothetical protein n=1 Tax=Bacillus sp. FJAT-44742 TaxID=2014005 RepID=UPI001E656F2E|nr:hypothetical protein [Bacillus sp. FJAT-44742]
MKMDVLVIILAIIVLAVYFSPFIFSSLQASFPFFNSFMKVKYTTIFAIIAVMFGLYMDPFPVQTVFLGMIAGSFMDFLLRD